MSTEQPLVSVIIPTFNREKFIGDAIRSVLDQTFQDFEVIVVDDGSTDRTAEIVRAFASDKVKYVYHTNRGRSNARNHALGLAAGRYIAFLDSDDLYLPNKLELQVNFLNTHPDVGMVYTSAYCVDENGSLLRDSYLANISGHIYKDIAFYVPVTITLPTVMARREVFEHVGGFDENMERFEDTDMWRRIAKVFTVGAITDFTCKLRTHGDNALAGQDPQQVVAAVMFYINKVFSEDASISLKIRRKGASGLCFFYARALLTIPSAVAFGRKLLLKSIGYAPASIYRLLFLGYYFFWRTYKKITVIGRPA
ncbi:MAG: glycosyltransferase [Methanosarcinales archaeon]|nr:MAG: glycosyltransferase [Methanosarcinales archaeon]